MSEEEINKIIAKFMGFDVLGVDKHDIQIHNEAKTMVSYIELYTKSMDALIPVVEKLKFSECLRYVPVAAEWWVCDTQYVEMMESDSSPSVALATACAKTIKQL